MFLTYIQYYYSRINSAQIELNFSNGYNRKAFTLYSYILNSILLRYGIALRRNYVIIA